MQRSGLAGRSAAMGAALIVGGGMFGLPAGAAGDTKPDALITAMLAETPILTDLEQLTDSIGGRITGSAANEAAVEWALATLREAGVPARAEEFRMPMQWREIAATAEVNGDASYRPQVVAKPFATGTPANGLRAALVDGGSGSAEDFERLGEAARDAWVIVATPVLNDDVGLSGLFSEYSEAAAVESRAFEAGVAGVVFMSSRPGNLLYRLFASRGPDNRHPLLIMEREEALRTLRLLRAGRALQLTATIEVEAGEPYTARNVIAEIRGRGAPEEIVIVGAHLDSHDLGTGALDNGANVAMLIDIARQVIRLGLEPRRTVRFALWNGEEQGLVGSWRYTEQHDAELDGVVMAASFDIGTGAITGFFTGGRPALVPLVDDYLAPVSGLGPFRQVDIPIVGTDNFDFMIEGVPNLVAVQADANYASNYHAESDTFDKVDAAQLKRNSAIAAALIWGFANDSRRLPRHAHDDIVKLIEQAGLEAQMRNFAVWDEWVGGTRGRHD